MQKFAGTLKTNRREFVLLLTMLGFGTILPTQYNLYKSKSNSLHNGPLKIVNGWIVNRRDIEVSAGDI